MNKTAVRLLLVFVAVLVGSGLLVYILLRSASSGRDVRSEPPAVSGDQRGVNTASPAGSGRVQDQGADSLLTELFGRDAAQAEQIEESSRGMVALRILLRFLIAALLAAFLAFRYRRGLSIAKRNPYVAQTQILLAVVAAAMMMIVGDSAARAFGIFAAASLVRFRTNIRDPKETTVLLICLGVGLACGVGRLDMAIVLTVFVILALWIMEHFESAQVFRAMEVHIGTRKLDETHAVLRRLFAKHDLSPELRQLDTQDEEGEVGKIVYELSLGSAITTDKLTEEILAEDGKNVRSLEWDQKKSSTYIYN
ncbi:MAG TPA: DUF4956 domain-containing protein [Pyrinomonadaceae bacterium]|nr:DUF4956 domain-containing protein [Pyrinomonadaceae bacterium]